mmetsp:Transcript_103757/g.211754  ORF Transcript_103757/g.211754 Transcript_103757/m.211754 type:complete len:137 (+) Transcript_103757:3923-4333(+)
MGDDGIFDWAEDDAIWNVFEFKVGSPFCLFAQFLSSEEDESSTHTISVLPDTTDPSSGCPSSERAKDDVANLENLLWRPIGVLFFNLLSTFTTRVLAVRLELFSSVGTVPGTALSAGLFITVLLSFSVMDLSGATT